MIQTSKRYSVPTCSRSMCVESARACMEYVLVLADIIKANDKDNVLKYPYRLARYKYEKGKLDKYKSACLCDLENPTNTLVSVFELIAKVSDIRLH